MSLKGFVYALINNAMPGLIKIGETSLDPRIRAKKLQSTGVPLPFTILIAKHVDNRKDVEEGIHLILNSLRVSQNREFFKCEEEKVKTLFELIPGEIWNPTNELNNDVLDDDLDDLDDLDDIDDLDDSDDDPDDSDNIIEEVNIIKPKIGCRIMANCFTDLQPIRHITRAHTWQGYYSKENDCIVCVGNEYKSISKFANAHNRIFNSKRKLNGAWDKCECLINNEWISTYNLPDLSLQ